MDFQFDFCQLMPMQPFSMMGRAIGQPFGLMPTVEQQEEYSLAFLNDQKQQIAQLQNYLKEYLKSLDGSLEIIEKEMSKISAARSQRQQSGTKAAHETRSKS